jgi:hypothetical protein
MSSAWPKRRGTSREHLIMLGVVDRAWWRADLQAKPASETAA